MVNNNKKKSNNNKKNKKNKKKSKTSNTTGQKKLQDNTNTKATTTTTTSNNNGKDNNGNSNNRRDDEKMIEITRRIETALSLANQIENPILGLESLLQMEPTNQQCIINIQYYTSQSLPDKIHNECLKLFEKNMSSMYEKSSWGLNLKEKSDEFHHKDAKFLIATITNTSNNNDGNVNNDYDDDDDVQLAGFAHYRYDVDDDDMPTEEVLYVYEIQINQDIQRCGLGKRLMNIMELIGIKSKMKKCMLTCFKYNDTATNFYCNKLKYNIDETSPSQFNEETDYEILSKPLVR